MSFIQSPLAELLYTVEPPNKGHVGTRSLFFIERCPLFGG